jgi:hypothetical protein
MLFLLGRVVLGQLLEQEQTMEQVRNLQMLWQMAAVEEVTLEQQEQKMRNLVALVEAEGGQLAT